MFAPFTRRRVSEDVTRHLLVSGNMLGWAEGSEVRAWVGKMVGEAVGFVVGALVGGKGTTKKPVMLLLNPPGSDNKTRSLINTRTTSVTPEIPSLPWSNYPGPTEQTGMGAPPPV